MNPTYFRTELTAKLELTIRGQKIPILAIRSGASWGSLAFLTTEKGFCQAFRPIPPYSDTLQEWHQIGDPVTTHYFHVTGTLPLIDENGQVKEAPQVFEIAYDYPRPPEMACHDCTPKTGTLFYRRDLVRIPLNDYEGNRTDRAKKYRLGPEDVPPDIIDDYERAHYVFHLCKQCASIRDTLNVLAEDQP